MATRLRTMLYAAALLTIVVSANVTQADPIADFYRGKTVNVLIGVGVGGEYDIQARLVARAHVVPHHHCIAINRGARRRGRAQRHHGAGQQGQRPGGGAR